MKTVLITEKRSQAVAISDALSGKRSGDGMEVTIAGTPVFVIWASGHLLSHENPDEANPDISWTDPATLVPIPSPKLKPSKGSTKYLGPIKTALKDASDVILCTDPDREGEGIGRNVLLAAGYRGTVRRMLLSGGMDPASIKKAASSIRPGDSTIAMWRAQEARALSDWMWQIPTRLYTMSARKGMMGPYLGTGREAVSVGRVQTTTLKLIVDRDLEIEHFVSQTHYKLGIAIQQGESKAVLGYVPDFPKEMIGEPVDGVTWIETEKGHRPIFTDRAAMIGVYTAIKGMAGSSHPLKVEAKPKQRHTPDCFSLTDLQKACGRRYKMTAARVLEAASKLYLDGYISYPRTEHGHLPPEMWDDAQSIIDGLSAVGYLSSATKAISDLHFHSATPPDRPRVYQKKDAPHFGLAPTKKVPAVESLSRDLANVYQAVTERYLQAHGSPVKMTSTKATMVLPVKAFGPSSNSTFSSTGITILDPGWTALFGDPDKSKDKEEKLPKLESGPAKLNGPEVSTEQTKAPPRYTEPSLLEAMLNAQRFAANADEAKILKAAEGIGTPATRDKIIETLIERKYVTREKSALISTGGGRDLIKHTPEGVQSVKLTAQWERELSEMASMPDAAAVSARDAFISKQRLHLESLVNEAIPKISAAVVPTTHSSRSGGSKMAGGPSERMLMYAKTLADRKGIKLPPDCLTDGTACKAFLDTHAPSGPNPPTEKQIAFAERLASESGKKLPDDYKTNYQSCKVFIEANMSKDGPASGGATAASGRPPSEKQVAFATKIAERRSVSIPANVLADGAKLSAWIDKNK